MRRTLSCLLSSLLLPAVLVAAPAATVVTGSGDAKIGKAGTFRPAVAGTAIGADEFLVLAAGAKATVKLPDGTTTEFAGKLAVPGRRLTTAREAGALVTLGQRIQGAAEAAVGVDSVATVPGSGKASGSGAESAADKAKRLGKSGSGVSYMADDDDDDAPPTTTDAFRAEDALERGNVADARKFAEGILQDARSAPLEQRRAAAVLGRLASEQFDVKSALAMYERAVAPMKGENAEAKSFRIAALVQRADFHRETGDLASARADLVAASDAYAVGDKTTPFAWHRANFLLGALFLDAGKLAEATERLQRVGSPQLDDKGPQYDKLRDLRAAADKLLVQAPAP